MPSHRMKPKSGAHNGNAGFWWKRAVFYEAYVDRFAGTFTGFAARLGYLKLLGVDCIHLLPHYPSAMNDGGYDVTDYMSVRKDLGTLADFAEFVKRAHAAGIRVMIDIVLNHASAKHPWFLEAQSSAKNPKRDYFLWSKNGIEYDGAPNPFSDLKPKNWIYNLRSGDYYFSTFHEQQADLNWNNPRVFAEMMRVLDFWIAFGVDGFRLDAPPHLVKKEGTASEGLPEVHAILKDIRAYLDRNHRDSLPLLAEVNNSIETSKQYFGNGNECDLVYNFRLAEALVPTLIWKDASRLRNVLAQLSGIPEQCAWANFFGHHDELSLKMLDEDLREALFARLDPDGKYRFKKGLSMRPAALLGRNREKILRAFELLFGAPGSPIIYYGDEIGMANAPLPAGEKDTRKSVRGTFDWREADAQASDPKSLFSRISSLIKDWKRGSAAESTAPAFATPASAAAAIPPAQ